jgi:tRNA (cytidine/uridine-2'-O-)-methyltransferase
MFDVVLYEPEIPGNTGNIIRLCANTGARLHLVKPLGFSIDDRDMKRAGLDYHEYARLTVHDDWPRCAAHFAARNVYAFSTKAPRLYGEARFARDDMFVFGPETRGLPPDVLRSLPEDRRLRLPMLPESRSLNLANTVAAVVFEAWRQCGFAGGR